MGLDARAQAGILQGNRRLKQLLIDEPDYRYKKLIVVFSQVQFHGELGDLALERGDPEFVAIALASAFSSFSSPRSNWVNQSWMRLAETS